MNDNIPTAASALQELESELPSDASFRLNFAEDPRLQELINSLPRLTEVDLGSECDNVCPICLVPFRAHLAEEEMALAMDSPAYAEEDLGVTRLEATCKHTFCRKDISAWIRQSRNSCPTCRRPLLDPLPPEDDHDEDMIQWLLHDDSFANPDTVRALVTLLTTGDEDYPERSEFGMYS